MVKSYNIIQKRDTGFMLNIEDGVIPFDIEGIVGDYIIFHFFTYFCINKLTIICEFVYYNTNYL